MFIVSVMRRCKDEILLQYVYKVQLFCMAMVMVMGDGDGFSVLRGKQGVSERVNGSKLD